MVKTVRYLGVCEEQRPQHPVFIEAQIGAGWQHFLQELLNHRVRLPALLPCQHFGLVIRSKNQPESICVKSELKHQQFPSFPQFTLSTATKFVNPDVRWINVNFVALHNQPYQLLVHHGLVTVEAVELVLQNYLRQRVIEELPGEQRRQVLEGRSDIRHRFAKEKVDN